MSAWDIFIRQFVELKGYNLVLKGLLNTVIIAVFGLLIGLIIGSLIAVVKAVHAKNPVIVVLQKIGEFYVAIFRGTPMIVQLLIIHYVLFPIMGISFNPIPLSDSFAMDGVVIEAVIAFGMNSAAYISEIMRSGIESIDKGQLEAGRALGLSYPRTMCSIVLPQAFRNVLPTLGNEFIALIKETSVAGFIAVMDLTKAFQSMANSTYEYIVPYLILALFYLIIVILITLLIKFLEKKMKKA